MRFVHVAVQGSTHCTTPSRACHEFDILFVLYDPRAASFSYFIPKYGTWPETANGSLQSNKFIVLPRTGLNR